MPFFSFFRARPEKTAARALYASIVNQARAEVFYREICVADTVDGRFELIVLHAVLVMRRLREAGSRGTLTAQALFDLMFEDMDMSLREMGVGDMTVPKKIKQMGEAFYGRAKAYEEALSGGNRGRLAAALARNVYRDESSADRAHALGDYAIKVKASLESQNPETLLSGHVSFPLAESTSDGGEMEGASP
jgi:cytochrome b pre-mRNA-processing protein 3